ncbi:hypothetical protein BU23DRAFT_600100 [Bimuria novae-zelandiae CBS 107.79]|uniref:MYND-type domain-containing protein n=1 Tax=Bimuria novae-zelandiae CBS 107.79 TaxID=1447943 RepID=A0A6A5VA29_9PLEO|nr:hypothetical protein BU23DRAFT_600100 [Bimuria novae-zelandiae CBS 107.79]
MNLSEQQKNHGGWSFTIESARHVTGVGFESPEQIFSAYNHGLRGPWVAQVKLTWCPGKLENFRVYRTGTVAQHMEAIAAERSVLGMPVFQAHDVPAYPTTSDVRLDAYRLSIHPEVPLFYIQNRDQPHPESQPGVILTREERERREQLVPFHSPLRPPFIPRPESIEEYIRITGGRVQTPPKPKRPQGFAYSRLTSYNLINREQAKATAAALVAAAEVTRSQLTSSAPPRHQQHASALPTQLQYEQLQYEQRQSEQRRSEQLQHQRFNGGTSRTPIVIPDTPQTQNSRPSYSPRPSTVYPTPYNSYNGSPPGVAQSSIDSSPLFVPPDTPELTNPHNPWRELPETPRSQVQPPVPDVARQSNSPILHSEDANPRSPLGNSEQPLNMPDAELYAPGLEAILESMDAIDSSAGTGNEAEDAQPLFNIDSPLGLTHMVEIPAVTGDGSVEGPECTEADPTPKFPEMLGLLDEDLTVVQDPKLGPSDGFTVRGASPYPDSRATCDICGKSLAFVNAPCHCSFCESKWYCGEDCRKRGWLSHSGTCSFGDLAATPESSRPSQPSQNSAQSSTNTQTLSETHRSSSTLPAIPAGDFGIGASFDQNLEPQWPTLTLPATPAGGFGNSASFDQNMGPRRPPSTLPEVPAGGYRIEPRFDQDNPFNTLMPLSEDVPCLVCGGTKYHALGCLIDDIQSRPVSHYSQAMLQNMKNQVRRNDPEQWREHHPPQPELEPFPIALAESNEIIRREESYRNDSFLQTVPDMWLPLMWALQTSPNVEFQLMTK